MLDSLLVVVSHCACLVEQLHATLLLGDILGKDVDTGGVLDLDFSVVRHGCVCRCVREKEGWAS